MQTVKRLLEVAINVVLVVLVVNALLLIFGWAFGLPLGWARTWGVAWPTVVTAAAVRTFIWLLPFAAVVMLLGLLFDTGYSSSQDA